MAERPIKNKETPSAREGFSVDDLEEQFAKALRRDMADAEMDKLYRQIEDSVQSLKQQSETPEDRVIRLCGELIDLCRPEAR